MPKKGCIPLADWLKDPSFQRKKIDCFLPPVISVPKKGIQPAFYVGTFFSDVILNTLLLNDDRLLLCICLPFLSLSLIIYLISIANLFLLFSEIWRITIIYLFPLDHSLLIYMVLNWNGSLLFVILSCKS